MCRIKPQEMRLAAVDDPNERTFFNIKLIERDIDGRCRLAVATGTRTDST
jgi:hypothetical protein